MQSHATKNETGCGRSVMPKPDLAVAFKTSSLINHFQMIELGDFRSHMCPEKFKMDKDEISLEFRDILKHGRSPRQPSF